MTDIKLIAIDLDGTLLNSQKDIPSENIETIKRATREGVKIVLCTGRPTSGTKPYFNQLDLVEDEYLILNNGCSTYKSLNWELIGHHALSLNQVEQLYKVSEQYPDIYLTLTTENHYYVVGEHVPDLVQADGDLVFNTVEAISMEALETNPEIIFQAMYMGEESAMDVFERENRSLLSESFSVVRSQSYILEIMPEGVTKAYALKELTEKLAFLPENVMAIGDAPNDIEMLSYAGLGIAMGNASEAIKVLADRVTLDCDHAGVSKAIKDYVLDI
ncbi:Cof-type HAD-IIB family hydrolase [Streptococcus uberis]|nr:Cof-type HAD-IIB family hydrolase [Streptococcus uberis]MCK1201755.1 Cof-type HAD-IIB family hydrolase [Streptococcus uberis]